MAVWWLLRGGKREPAPRGDRRRLSHTVIALWETGVLELVQPVCQCGLISFLGNGPGTAQNNTEDSFFSANSATSTARELDSLSCAVQTI